MNLLEIGKIVRVHGIKGAVKIISFIDEDFSIFKKVYLTEKHLISNITQVKKLNNDAYSVTFDTIPTIDDAEKYKNKSVYIDRNDYSHFKDKVYLSDLINKPVRSETGEELGIMVDYDDYGASIILTIRCGAVSVMIPYVADIINFDAKQDCFIIERQKFEDLKV